MQTKNSFSLPSGTVWRRAFQYAVVLTLTALLLAGLCLSVFNDMYAFVKPHEWVEITVTTPLSIAAFSRLLDTHRILRNPHIFSLYVKQKHQMQTVEQFSGTVRLNTAMSYREILNELALAKKIENN